MNISSFKLSTLINFSVLMGLIFYGCIGSAQSPQATVHLTTTPPESQLIPFEAEAVKQQSPVHLKLQAVDAAGHALKNAYFRLQILTPSPTPWLTTDFPIVEGTKLLDIEANSPTGELQLQQMLPIRGNYQLLVSVTPTIANAFTPIQQTITLGVAENWIKYRNGGILAVILLIVGLGGGWVIGGPQNIQPGEFAPQRVRLLLSGATLVAIMALVVVNVSAELPDSHAHEHHQEHSQKVDNPPVLQSKGLELRLAGNDHTTVGKLANFTAQVIDTQTGKPATDVLFSVKATQMEHDWITFAYLGTPDTTGKLVWKQQFFDGAPYKVDVEVSPQPTAVHQFSPFRVSKDIDVEPVAPPVTVRFTSLAYFTSIVVAGLLLGLGWRRGWTIKAWLNT